MTQKKASTVPETKTVAAVVLCTSPVGGRTYVAGCVIDGMPEDIAQAHTNVLNLSPEAVTLAKERGAAMVQFQA